VVSKLILLIILGFVAALYFPDSRQSLINTAMPVLEPVYVWSAEREITDLITSVRREARGTSGLPATRSWNAWLTANFTGDITTDPWGKTYSYQAWPDSFAIRSDGPDGQTDTEDDIRGSFRRPF